MCNSANCQGRSQSRNLRITSPMLYQQHQHTTCYSHCCNQLTVLSAAFFDVMTGMQSYNTHFNSQLITVSNYLTINSTLQHCLSYYMAATRMSPCSSTAYRTLRHQDISAPVQNGAEVSRDNSAPVFYWCRTVHILGHQCRNTSRHFGTIHEKYIWAIVSSE